LLSESHVKIRVEAFRLGLFLGGMSGLYKLVSGFLRLYRKKEDGFNSFWGGVVAGLSLSAFHPSR
jgi:hypothetical protein